MTDIIWGLETKKSHKLHPITGVSLKMGVFRVLVSAFLTVEKSGLEVNTVDAQVSPFSEGQKVANTGHTVLKHFISLGPHGSQKEKSRVCLLSIWLDAENVYEKHKVSCQQKIILFSHLLTH